MLILWICDSWSSINNPNETTLRLMEESVKLGLDNWFSDSASIRIKKSILLVDAFAIDYVSDYGKVTISNLSEERNLASFGKIFFRCDPPFDSSYFLKLQLIFIEFKKTTSKFEVINDARSLLTFNSKTCSEVFDKDIVPKTLFASQWKVLKEFGIRQKKVVAKSLLKGSSEGIELLRWESIEDVKHSKLVLNEMTLNFTQHILVQEYIDLLGINEIRIWFANGEFVCCAGKKLKGAEFKFKVDQGDELIVHKLSEEEQWIAKKIGFFLKKENIKIAAVDIIANKITDFNIASPGLLKEIEKLWGENFSEKILRTILDKR
jgi:glutathione synthase